MSAPAIDERADRVAAWATGAGIGALAFMLTWLIGNRLGEILWGRATGAWVALITSVVAGLAVTAVAGARLARRVLS